MIDERRQFFRVRERFPITLHTLYNDKVIKGKVLNIGAGGVLVELSEAVPVGEEVSLQVILDQKKPFFALARVERIQNEARREYALLFTKVDDNDRLLLFKNISADLMKQ